MCYHCYAGYAGLKEAVVRVILCVVNVKLIVKYDVIQLLFLYIKGYLPSELSWYHGDEKLEAEDCSGPYLSCRKLILSSVTLESSGNLYTCRGTELKEISWATGQIYVNSKSIKETQLHCKWQLRTLKLSRGLQVDQKVL